MALDNLPDLKPRSRDTMDSPKRAAVRGLLRTVGFGDAHSALHD